MPIYEYKCSDCECRFEMRRGFSESNAPAACPKCQTGRGKRLLSRFASFSRDTSGDVAPVAGGGGGCAGCAGGSCSSCGH